MKLFQTSGPALFMYTVIACCLIASLVCFYVYYNAVMLYPADPARFTFSIKIVVLRVHCR